MAMNFLKTVHKRNGFTYLELVIGVSILLVVLGSVITVLRMSATNKAKTKEMMAMSTFAQNAAEIYKAEVGTTPASVTSAIAVVMAQGLAEGFSATQVAVNQNTNLPVGMNTVIITVSPRVLTTDLTNYILQFYMVDKSKFP